MRRGPLFRTVCLALVLLALFVLRKACAGEPSFPYEASVAGGGAVVHSGNGEKFYATNRLEPGARVLVHRHDPHGWHMIAPPEGAYSLIPAYSFEPLNENLAEIVANGVCTRVGSSIGKEFSVEQIPLRIGTRVELLPDQSAPEGWIAIRPPRGEYRWVRAGDLEPADPKPSSLKTDRMESAEQSNSLFDSMPELDRQLAGLENEDPALWPLEALSLGYLRIKRTHLDLAREIDARLERIAELKEVRDEHLGQAATVETGEPAEMTPAEPAKPADVNSYKAAQPVRQANRPAPAGSEYYPTNIATLSEGEPILTPNDRNGDDGPDFPREDAPKADFPTVRPPSRSPHLPPGSRMTPPATSTPSANPMAAKMPPASAPTPNSTAPSPQPGTMPSPRGGTPRRFDAVGYIQKAVNPPSGAPVYVLVSREGRILAYLKQPANTSFESFVGYPMGVDGQPRQQPGLQLPLISVERLTPVRFP